MQTLQCMIFPLPSPDDPNNSEASDPDAIGTGSFVDPPLQEQNQRNRQAMLAWTCAGAWA